MDQTHDMKQNGMLPELQGFPTAGPFCTKNWVWAGGLGT